MIRLTLAALGCLAISDGPPAAPGPDASYEQKRAGAGRDAASQIDLALWCEARGLETQKVKHLGIAVLTDPSNALARGLLGLVEYGGKWRRPEAVAASLKVDVARADLMAEYAGRRMRTPVKPDAQFKLATWCEEKGLRDEARAHLATVVRLDPNHADAWRRLGYKKVGKRWVTAAQADREKAERLAQQDADKKWRPRLERLREALDGKGQRKDEALRELASINDPRAVPAVWHAFVERGGNHQVEAVQLLGQIDAIEASRALAAIALFGKSPEVRRRATESLRRRDPREWADRLIVLFNDPIKYEVRRVGGPGSPGSLYVEGKEANLKRFYSPPPPPTFAIGPNDTISTDDFGLPVLVKHSTEMVGGTLVPSTRGETASSMVDRGLGVNPNVLTGTPLANNPFVQTAVRDVSSGMKQQRDTILEQWRAGSGGVNPTQVGISQRVDSWVAIPVGQMIVQSQQVAAAAEAQLEGDLRQITDRNSAIVAMNERIAIVLNQATSAGLPAERKPWDTWFANQLGVVSKAVTQDDVPTVIEDVPLAYSPRPVPVASGVTSVGNPTVFLHHSCFAKGTMVRTVAGPEAIETMSVGDLVLTQDTASGKLGYRPIVTVFHNPPSPTFKVALGGDPIVTSPSHRFWVAGQGWVMARDLKVGDPVRTLGGVAKVASIETGEVQPVFNLDVEDDADFFVGSPAALVHDNTLPDLKQAPFDAPAPVAAAK